MTWDTATTADDVNLTRISVLRLIVMMEWCAQAHYVGKEILLVSVGIDF